MNLSVGEKSYFVMVQSASERCGLLRALLACKVCDEFASFARGEPISLPLDRALGTDWALVVVGDMWFGEENHTSSPAIARLVEEGGLAHFRSMIADTSRLDMPMLQKRVLSSITSIVGGASDRIELVRSIWSILHEDNRTQVLGDLASCLYAENYPGLDGALAEHGSMIPVRLLGGLGALLLRYLQTVSKPSGDDENRVHSLYTSLVVEGTNEYAATLLRANRVLLSCDDREYLLFKPTYERLSTSENRLPIPCVADCAFFFLWHCNEGRPNGYVLWCERSEYRRGIYCLVRRGESPSRRGDAEDPWRRMTKPAPVDFVGYRLIAKGIARFGVDPYQEGTLREITYEMGYTWDGFVSDLKALARNKKERSTFRYSSSEV